MTQVAAAQSASLAATSKRKWKTWRVVCAIIALLVLAYVGRFTFSIIKWSAYTWLPSYLLTPTSEPSAPDLGKHLIFVMADHYEPGRGPHGVRINSDWLSRFRPVADAHHDSYGNRFRYSWFYPYDELNEPVLKSLSRMTYDGYGEVDFHWHHPPANSEAMPAMMDEAIAWFQRYGALVSSGPQPKTSFAFIHGNFCLDNSTPRCGVNNELAILFEHGCYADFTFSTIGTPAQPAKVNSLYYVRDTDSPKSYEVGHDVRVGVSINDELLIFEGPSALRLWPAGSLEYGAVEEYALPSAERINNWISANIHVQGRPEWVFVKVYSHGCQSADAILRKHLDPMLTAIETICKERGIALHYMTAREAYNVVKAAEDDQRDDPETYRDYRIPKPQNMVQRFDTPQEVPAGGFESAHKP